MSLLSQMVLCSTSCTGMLCENHDELPKKVKEALKSVTKRQRHKFVNDRVVPVPVLVALWYLGFFPGDEVPRKGMKILVLTEWLRQGLYKNEQAAENGHWLYTQIMKEEVIGRKQIVKKEKFPHVNIKYSKRPKNINTQQSN